MTSQTNVQPARSSGFGRQGWLHEAPYAAMLLLTLGGVAYSALTRSPLQHYWQFVALFTRTFGARGLANYDHSSGFIWQFGTACLAFAIVVWFGREVKRGRVIPYARREFENRDPKAAAGEIAPIAER